MKYFLAFMIIPTVPILLLVVFGIGALYFAVDSILERKEQKKITGQLYIRSVRPKAPGLNILQTH